MAGLEKHFSSQNERVNSLETLLASEKDRGVVLQDQKVNLEGALDMQRGDTDKLRSQIRELMEQGHEASDQTRKLYQTIGTCFSFARCSLLLIDKMREEHQRQLSDKEFDLQRAQRGYDQERANLASARIELDTLKVCTCITAPQ